MLENNIKINLGEELCEDMVNVFSVSIEICD
jgi:hypothetical protein